MLVGAYSEFTRRQSWGHDSMAEKTGNHEKMQKKISQLISRVHEFREEMTLHGCGRQQQRDKKKRKFGRKSKQALLPQMADVMVGQSKTGLKGIVE